MSSKLFAFYDPDFDIYDENTSVSRPIVGYIDLSDGKFFTYAAERKKAVSHEFIKKLEINSVEDLEKEDKFYTIFRFELDNSNTNQKLCNIIGSKMVGKKSLNSALMYQDDDGAWIKAYITKINNDKTYDITYRKDRKQFKITNVPLGNRLKKPFMKVNTRVKFINDEKKKGVVTYGITHNHHVMLLDKDGNEVGEVRADIDTITYDDGHQPILRATKNMKEFKEKIKNRQKCLKINKDKCEKRLKDEYTEKCAIKNEEECRKTEYCNYKSGWGWSSGSCSLDNKKIKKHIEKEVSNCPEYDECFNLDDGVDTRYLRPLIPQYFPEETNRAPMCLKKTPKPFLDMDELSLDNIQKMFNLEPVETLKENYENIYNLKTEISKKEITEKEKEKMNKDYNKDYKKIENGQIKLMNYIKSQKWTEGDFDYYTTMYRMINRMLNDKIQKTTVENFTDEAMKYLNTQENSAEDLNNLSEEGQNNLSKDIEKLINNEFTNHVDNVSQADIIDDNTVYMTENGNQEGGWWNNEYEDEEYEEKEEGKNKDVLLPMYRAFLSDAEASIKSLEEKGSNQELTLTLDEKIEIQEKINYYEEEIFKFKKEITNITTPPRSIWQTIKSYGKNIFNTLKEFIKKLTILFSIKNFKIVWKILKKIHNNHWVVLAFLATLKVLRKQMCKYISEKLYGQILNTPEHMGSTWLGSVGNMLDMLEDGNWYGRLQIIFLDMINSKEMWDKLEPTWKASSLLFTGGLNLTNWITGTIGVTSFLTGNIVMTGLANIGSVFLSAMGQILQGISIIIQNFGLPIIKITFALYIERLFYDQTWKEIKELITDVCLDPNIKKHVKKKMTPSQEAEFYKENKNENWTFYLSDLYNNLNPLHIMDSYHGDYHLIKEFMRKQWRITNAKEKFKKYNGETYWPARDNYITIAKSANNVNMKRWGFLEEGINPGIRPDLKNLFDKAKEEVEKEEMEEYNKWKESIEIPPDDRTISNTSQGFFSYMSDIFNNMFAVKEVQEILALPMGSSTTNTTNAANTTNTTNIFNTSNISNIS